MPANIRGRTEVVALALTVVVCGALALDVVPAIADAEKLEGRPVPAEDVPHLVAAALSCPALTPPKLAAQVMAATAFGTDGSNRGLSGMDEAAWSKWRPFAGADRKDHEAGILAVAHRTCEAVGELRAAKVDGDLWSAALAAEKAGLPAVVAAKGVPGSAETYVAKVTAYSYWYAEQPQFTIGKTAAATSAAPSPEPVPADLVADINAAGRICPTVTPARVAAQLRALSGFNPSLRSADGAAGIAQFSDELWEEYRPGAAASRWNPDDAIPAMGTAMCDMTNQLTGLGGTDPYKLALGAYQWGLGVIRQAAGLPRGTVPQLADRVEQYVGGYEKDSRLHNRTKPAPSPSPSASPSNKAPTSPAPSSSPMSVSPTPTPTPSASATATPSKTPAVAFDPDARYQIRNAWAGAVLEVPDGAATAANTRIELWNNKNEKGQYWRIAKAKAAGYVLIVNDLTGQALALEGKSTANRAKVVVVAKNSSAVSQQWKLTDEGDGKVSIENRNSGKVMELLGDDLGPPFADGTWNGYWVEQYDRVPTTNRDQFWLLVK